MISPTLDNILKSVSRSFYLSLRALPASARPAMSIGYLLCRAADTISDTDAVPFTQRANTLRSFKQTLDAFPLDGAPFRELLEKLKEYGSFHKNDEGRLLAALPLCAQAFSSLSKTEQALVQQVTNGVIRGMEMDLSSFGDSAATAKALNTKKDLESYLAAIGGEPGRFWSLLCLTHYPMTAKKNKSRWIEDGVRFGTGLQMINILRDLSEDLGRGRCYISKEQLNEHNLNLHNLIENDQPELFRTLYHQLIDDTLNRLEHGVEYLAQIPKKYFRLRMTIWWPLAIGLKTLARLRAIDDPLKGKNKIRITRSEVYRSLLASFPLVISDALLLRVYKRGFAAASSAAVRG